MTRLSGVDNTGRSTRAPKREVQRRNKPPEGEPWVWLTREILSSPAFRVLSLNARRILERLMVEHMDHSGQANGDLICTYSDFQKWGVRRNAIAKGLDELEGVGLMKRIKHGGFSCGGTRNVSTYRLEWLCDLDGRPATNSWKKIRTLEDAREAVGAALQPARDAKIARAAYRRKMQLAAKSETKRAAA